MIERLMYLIRDTDLAEKLNKYLLKRIPVRGAEDERLNVEDPTAPPPMYVDDDERMVENFETAILPDSDVLNSSQETQENATTQATDFDASFVITPQNSTSNDAITPENSLSNYFAPTRSGETVIVHFEDPALQTEYYTHKATVEAFNLQEYNYSIKLTKEEASRNSEIFVTFKVQFIARDNIPDVANLSPGVGVLFRDIDNEEDNNNFWNRGVITAVYYEDFDGVISDTPPAGLMERDIAMRFQIQQIFHEQEFSDIRNIGVKRPENTFGIVSCVPFDMRLVANELDAIHCWQNM